MLGPGPEMELWLGFSLEHLGQGEYISAPGTRRAKFSHALVWFGVGIKDPHSSVWPLDWSVTHKRGIL